MISVAPCNIIPVLNKAHPWVITVFPHKHFLVCSLKADWLILNFPVDAVPASARKDIHTDGFAVAAEHTRIPALKRYYCTVKYTVGNPVSIPPDNGIFAVAPQRHLIPLGLFLPGNARQRLSDNFAHSIVLRFFFIFINSYCFIQ